MLQSRQRRECRPSSGAARLEQPPAAPSSWHHDIVVRRDAGTRTHSREDEVLKDLLVNLLEGARARALLLDARAAGRLAHHAALADEDDVAVRELLLELAGEAARTGEGASATLEREHEGGRRGDGPALDLVEGLDLGDRDEDDDGLLATLDVNLAGRRDLEGTELGLEVRDVVLEVEEGLGDEGLRGVRRGARRVGGPEDLCVCSLGSACCARRGCRARGRARRRTLALTDCWRGCTRTGRNGQHAPLRQAVSWDVAPVLLASARISSRRERLGDPLLLVDPSQLDPAAAPRRHLPAPSAGCCAAHSCPGALCSPSRPPSTTAGRRCEPRAAARTLLAVDDRRRLARGAWWCAGGVSSRGVQGAQQGASD